MCSAPISLNLDLKRLADEGYDISIVAGHLLIESVPYLTADKVVKYGKLIFPLLLNGGKTMRPDDHVAWFCGEGPCDASGRALTGVINQAGSFPKTPEITAQFMFSAKPPGGYVDYYQKTVNYINLLAAPAQAIRGDVTARVYKPRPSIESESVFLYEDTAAARAGIAAISHKLHMGKVAVIGLGGTGSYVLDHLAKTGIKEIHLYDGDKFFQHNAFRAPGAASLQELEEALFKVDHYARCYGKMRRGIFPHPIYITDETIHQLQDMDFVFICVDRPAVRGLIFDFLHTHKVAFIDVGMEVKLVAESKQLIGMCRTTLSTPEKNDHLHALVTTTDRAVDNLYLSNIQVSELNALNACLAVLKWKKYCGFYQDAMHEHNSLYSINTHHLSKDEQT